MPRMYDYDAGDIGAVEYHGKTLEPRATGRLENSEEFFGPPMSMNWYYGQFKSYIYDTAFMDQVHAWIDENATADWYWYESSSNHGHSVETNIWFSSLDDLSVFAGEWEGKGPTASQVITFSDHALRLNGSSILGRKALRAKNEEADQEAVVMYDGP